MRNSDSLKTVVAPISTPRRQRTGRSALFGLVLVVSSVLPFLLAPVRANWLGPSARGEFAYFQSSLTVVLACGGLGVRHAVYSLGVGDWGPRHRVLPVVFAGCCASLTVAAPLSIIGFVSISTFVGWAILLSVLLAPGTVLFQLGLARSQISGNEQRTTFGLASPSLLDFILNMATVLTHTMTLISSVAVTIAAEIWRGSTSLFWHLRGRIDRAKLDGVTPRAHLLLRSALRYAPVAILPMVAGNVDVLIYGALLPTTSVGIYVVAKLGFMLFIPLASAIEGRVLAVSFSSGIRRALVRVGVVGLVAGTIIGTFGAVLVPTLFGQEYAAAVWALPIACLAGLLRLVHSSMVVILSSRGKVRALQTSTGVLLLATVVGAVVVCVCGGGGLFLMMSILVGAQVCAVIALLGHRRTEKRIEGALDDDASV